MASRGAPNSEERTLAGESPEKNVNHPSRYTRGGVEFIDANKGRRVMLDGIVYRLVRVADVVAVAEN